jgi:hypothetical protein
LVQEIDAKIAPEGANIRLAAPPIIPIADAKGAVLIDVQLRAEGREPGAQDSFVDDEVLVPFDRDLPAGSGLAAESGRRGDDLQRTRATPDYFDPIRLRNPLDQLRPSSAAVRSRR